MFGEKTERISELEKEKTALNKIIRDHYKVICWAVRELVPCDFKQGLEIASKDDILSGYLAMLEHEREEQIQDDILREKVEKIVLALRAHKWEPA